MMPARSLSLFLVLAVASASRAAEPSVAGYPSIQAALDANPNRLLFVPAGDYPITEPIRIGGDRSGLFGPGRVIQQNPDSPIIIVDGPRMRRSATSRSRVRKGAWTPPAMESSP